MHRTGSEVHHNLGFACVSMSERIKQLMNKRGVTVTEHMQLGYDGGVGSQMGADLASLTATLTQGRSGVHTEQRRRT